MFLLADPEKAVLGLNTFKDLDVQYPDVSGILASAVWSPFPEPAPLLEAPKRWEIREAERTQDFDFGESWIWGGEHEQNMSNGQTHTIWLKPFDKSYTEVRGWTQ